MTASLLGYVHVSHLVLLLLALPMVLTSSHEHSSEPDKDFEAAGHRGPGCRHDLVCLIQKTVFLNEVDDGSGGIKHEHSEKFDCIMEENGLPYFIDLPQDFLDSHPYLDDGLTRVSISDACVSSTTVTYQSNATITALPGQQRRLAITGDERTLKNASIAIVKIDVASSPGIVTDDPDTIAGRMWNDHEGSVKTMFRQLSFGKMDVHPAQGPSSGAHNGIYVMYFPIDVGNFQNREVENMALQAGGQELEKLHDFVMYCIPRGSKIGNSTAWAAYAIKDHPRSVYNDGLCGLLFPTMHELGHNVGLQVARTTHTPVGHSNSRDGLVYGDHTGFMGNNGRGGWPEWGPVRGYNAAKNWWLGWYADRHVDLTNTINDKPWSGRLVPFVDYDKAPSTDAVVIKVGDLYIQYNRVKAFNIGQWEKQNEVTIVAAYQGLTRLSNLLAGLKPQEFYAQGNFTQGHDIFIELCKRVDGEEDFDYAHVSIFLDDGIQSSQCSQPLPPLPSQEPSMVPTTSIQPSLEPTQVPSMAPTTSMQPSLEPTLEPTQAPSVEPTQVPSMAPTTSMQPSLEPTLEPTQAPSVEPTTSGKPSIEPSHGPSTIPSGKPSSSPTSLPTLDCTDRDDTVPINRRFGNQTCEWIAGHRGFKRWLCQPGFEAFEQCQETCDSCRKQQLVAEVKAKQSTSCEDTREMVYINDHIGKMRCFYLGQFLKRSPHWKSRLCAPSTVKETCRETCGTCMETCHDRNGTHLFYTTKRQGGWHGCEWLSSRPLWQAKLCNPTSRLGRRYRVDLSCPDTCDSCDPLP